MENKLHTKRTIHAPFILVGIAVLCYGLACFIGCQSDDPAGSSPIGNIQEFNIAKHSGTGYNKISAKLILQSKYSNIWCNTTVSLTDRTYRKVTEVKDAFDEEIYDLVTTYYVPLPDVDNNGRIEIVLTPDEDGMGGFVDPTQIFSLDTSLKGELFVINTLTLQLLGADYIKAVMMHELVHLAELSYTTLVEDTIDPTTIVTQNDYASIASFTLWISEGMATLGEFIYAEQTAAAFNKRWSIYDAEEKFTILEGTEQNFIYNGRPLFIFKNEETDYAQSFSFLTYLFLQLGETFAQDCIHHPNEDATALVELAQDGGLIEQEEGMKELMGLWALAMYRKESSGVYGFKDALAPNTTDPQAPYYSILRDSVQLLGGGVLYFPIQPDTPFSPEPAEDIAYIGYNTSTQTIDADPEGGYSGDVLIVYNYDWELPYNSKQADIPTEAMIRTD